MKYFDVFAGVGGFKLGIHNAMQAECIGFSEYDRYASDVLRYHYPNIKNYGDITKIDWSEVPDFDLLVGGSPCQSFSIAGKRTGFNGASGLFWEYLRCLQEKKPDYFIWENVKGVLSSNHGFDFANIVNSFSEAGYALWWQVLNAKDFGVPQNRERVFVVGTRSGCPGEIFFERESNPINNEQNTQGDDVAHTLNCGDKHRGSYVRPDEPRLRQVRCIPNNPNSWGGQTHPANPRIRRLTERECEKLMSWSPDWTKYGRKEDGTIYEISSTQRYKQCGNGVVSKVVEHLIREHFNP